MRLQGKHDNTHGSVKNEGLRGTVKELSTTTTTTVIEKMMEEDGKLRNTAENDRQRMEVTAESAADCGEGRNSIGGNDGSRSAEVSKQAADHPDARQGGHEEAIESEHVEKNSEIHSSELEREEVDVVSFEPSQQQANITPLSGESSDVESTIIGLRLVGSAHHPRKARKAESEVTVHETPDTSP